MASRSADHSSPVGGEISHMEKLMACAGREKNSESSCLKSKRSICSVLPKSTKRTSAVFEVTSTL